MLTGPASLNISPVGALEATPPPFNLTEKPTFIVMAIVT
jgi:hypothetical protein